MPDYEKINKICRKNKIPLIEDAAESLGSIYKTRKAGLLVSLLFLVFIEQKL